VCDPERDANDANDGGGRFGDARLIPGESESRARRSPREVGRMGYVALSGSEGSEDSDPWGTP